MELNNGSTVKQLVEWFNDRTYKYQDVMNTFNCSRDTVQKRLNGIGLQWDNSAKKMIGDPTADDLNIQLGTLFEKQRRSRSPKVVNPTSKQVGKTDNKQVSKQVGNPTNKQLKKVTYEIEEQLHDQLRIKAILDKRTVSEIVNDIIKRGINEYSNK